MKPKISFSNGNYRNYYFKRLGSNQLDIRVELMKLYPEYFRHKTVLDIGCNSGFVTISIAKHLCPLSVLGIDIDGHLIEQARKNLQREKTDLTFYEEAATSLNKVLFRKANYILNDRSLIELEKPQYDVILCLSVTKWIHLNYGDEGIKFIFKRIHRQLKPNGIFVLEAQPFGGYKKRSKLSPEISSNYKSIQLRPEQFEKYLLSEEGGFCDTWCMTNDEILKNSSLPKGFHRPLQVFVKR